MRYRKQSPLFPQNHLRGTVLLLDVGCESLIGGSALRAGRSMSRGKFKD